MIRSPSTLISSSSPSRRLNTLRNSDGTTTRPSSSILRTTPVLFIAPLCLGKPATTLAESPTWARRGQALAVPAGSGGVDAARRPAARAGGGDAGGWEGETTARELRPPE